MRNIADIGMSERMVPDLVAFAIDALGDVTEFIRLDADQEKRCRSVFTLEHVQDFGRPLRIGPIVKSYRDLVAASSVARHTVRRWQRREGFVGDKASC